MLKMEKTEEEQILKTKSKHFYGSSAHAGHVACPSERLQKNESTRLGVAGGATARLIIEGRLKRNLDFTK